MKALLIIHDALGKKPRTRVVGCSHNTERDATAVKIFSKVREYNAYKFDPEKDLILKVDLVEYGSPEFATYNRENLQEEIEDDSEDA